MHGSEGGEGHPFPTPINQRRTHQGLDRRTPDEVYFQTNGLRKAT